jgi:hypothetical protein
LNDFSLQDGTGQTIDLSANGSFSFPNPDSSYAVSVQIQPSNPAQTCTVTNGSGTATANVTNISINCGGTVGGVVYGLTGSGLVLEDNVGDKASVSANGNFTFSTVFASGVTYNVTILSQPTSPSQNCAVTNGSGTVTVNVSLQVVCGNQWSWVSGSNAFLQPGTYGVKGTPASTNIPGSRSAMVSWKDKTGNLRLYSGEGDDFSPPYAFAFYGDFWELSPTTGYWTWQGGVEGQNAGIGVWGSQGKAASTNTPGYRSNSSNWVDSSGNLWLFGGYSSSSTGSGGSLNDMWEYSQSLSQWIWMGGSSLVEQPGIYGVQGSPGSGTSIPGSRALAMSWTDASGNFWLFGGSGYDSAATVGYLNDLWKFNPALGAYGEWTWMGGNTTVPAANTGQNGIYGQQGTPVSGNLPGGRGEATTWTDSSGKFWLFGGSGYDSAGNFGDLNDLWKFDPALGTYGEWAWMGGSNTVPEYGGQTGVYGTLGTPASGNIPGGRQGAVSWIDASGNFWLFGGLGYDSAGNYGYLNDLWKYTPSATGDTGEWTWMAGSNLANQQGVLDTATPSSNVPPGLTDAAGWTDSSGNLWLFGGDTINSPGATGSVNGLWEYKP